MTDCDTEAQRKGSKKKGKGKKMTQEPTMALTEAQKEVRERQYRVVMNSYFEGLINADDVISLLAGTDDWDPNSRNRVTRALGSVNWGNILEEQTQLTLKLQSSLLTGGGLRENQQGLWLSDLGLVNTAAEVLHELSGVILNTDIDWNTAFANWVIKKVTQAEADDLLNTLADGGPPPEVDSEGLLSVEGTGYGWEAAPGIILDAWIGSGITPTLRAILTLSTALMFGE